MSRRHPYDRWEQILTVEQLRELLAGCPRPLTIQIEGRSMGPALQGARRVTIIPFRTDYRLRPAELIVFQRGGALVCHRLWHLIRLGKSRWVLEKGDGNWLPRLIPARSICGVVRSIDNNPVIPPPLQELTLTQLLWRWLTDSALRLVRCPH